MPSPLSLQCLTMIVKTQVSFEISVCTVRHGVILWRKSRQQHTFDGVKSPKSALLYLTVN
jgi:hypothetical protein